MSTLKHGVKKMASIFRARKKKSPESLQQRFIRYKFIRPRLERLEDRTLLSSGLGTDLTTYFQNLLNSQSASFSQTQTINNVSLGGFLQMNSLTLNENATLTNGVWSGTIGLSAPSATLYPGHSFSGAITSSELSQPALTGTVTITAGTTSGTNDFAFALTIPSTASLVLNVGEALTITASNVTLDYSSPGTDNQTLATIGTATATSPQFSNMSPATLSNFALREDGFSFDSFTLSSATGSNPSIGNFLTTTGVTLTATGSTASSPFDVFFGTSTENPTAAVDGTIGITVTGLQLFPTGNYVQLSTTGVTASYNFANFDGTDPTGQLSITISGFELTIGQALQLSAVDSSGNPTSVTITPDQSVMATIASLTLSSPLLTGMGRTTVSNLQIDQDGFSLGSVQWTSPGAVTIGSDLLSLGSVEVDVNNFALQYGTTPTVSGTISFTAANASLFSGMSLLNVGLGSLTGSFDFGNAASPGQMNIDISNLKIALGQALTIDVEDADLTPGQSTILTATNATVTANLFSGLAPFTLPSFTVTTTGFSLGSFTISPVSAGSAVTIGNFLSLSGVSIDVNNFAVNTATETVSGSISATIGDMALFPGGNTPVTSSFTNIQASYDFASQTDPGQLSLTVGTMSLSLLNQISLTASNVAITPGQSTLATIAQASLTVAPLDNLNMEVDNLAIEQTGFTIASASASLASNLTLGSVLTVNTPAVTLTNIAYIFGGSLTGTVGISSAGASLELGSTLDASLGQTTGSYDLGTEALSVTLNTFSLNVAGFADLSAATLSLNYVPATSGSSQMTVGATGVTAFMGSGTPSSGVGVYLTGGTLALAVFDTGSSGSPANAITYALQVSGTLGFLGLSSAFQVTPGNVEFLDDTAGKVSTTVQVGSTAVPLDFTENETEVVAQGLSLSAGGFASLSGDFGFQEFTSNGDTYVAVGAENVDATVAVSGVSVALTGGSLALLIDTTNSNYALVAGGGTDSLTGVTGLTLTGTDLSIRVRHGLDPSTVTLPNGGIVTPDGTINLDFSSLGTGSSDLTDVEGNATLAISNFVSLQGSFGFQEFQDNSATYFAVGASNLNITLGTSTTNVTLAGASFGLILAPGTGYALEAQADSIALNGVNGLTLSGSNVTVLARSGLDVSGDTSIPSSVQTPDGAVTLDFSGLGSGTATVASITGSLSLAVANLGTLQGDFGLQTYVDQSGVRQIAIGAMITKATIGTSSTYVEVDNATLGALIDPGTGGNATTFALEETGGAASLQGVTGLTLSASNLMVAAREGLNPSAATGLPTIQTSGGAVQLNFSGMGPGPDDLFAVSGVAQLDVSNFVSLTGAFGLQVNTVGSNTYLSAGIYGNVTLTAGTTSLALNNLSVGVLVDDNANTGTTYALQATEGNGSTTTFSGPDGISLSASDLSVLVDHGLNVSSYPSGVPTSISVPGFTQTTTETDAPATTITLKQAANPGTLSLSYTLGGSTTQLTSDDYTLSADAQGNTIVTFTNNIPPAGSTVTASYSYTEQPPTSTQTATETFTPADSITLQNAATASSLVVSYTPSGSTTATTLTAADYTLGTDANGNTTITFTNNAPPAGSTISASYSYDQSTSETFAPASSITLQHANVGTLTVTYTTSSSSTPITVADADYTVGTDSNGNTTITFTSGNEPPAGSTITVA
ncbi:MAG: beta strand repeat-containing protein [Gemmataceae bacterium]